MQTVTTPAHARHNAQRIGRWLLLWAASLFLLVLIGGGTRLTESGLSITEWKPVTGVLPPLTAADLVSAVRYVLSAPPGVQICDIQLRPSAQPF